VQLGLPDMGAAVLIEYYLLTIDDQQSRHLSASHLPDLPRASAPVSRNSR
jgi:hypothetical protein